MQYVYQVIEPDPDGKYLGQKLVIALNEWGGDGWRLVSLDVTGLLVLELALDSVPLALRHEHDPMHSEDFHNGDDLLGALEQSLVRPDDDGKP